MFRVPSVLVLLLTVKHFGPGSLFMKHFGPGSFFGFFFR
jgi:hypothetical protein